MTLEITTIPNPILREPAKPINAQMIADPEFQKFLDDLTETMYVKDGVGIAAPQVNRSIQVCVITKKYSTYQKGEDLILINPVWEKLTRLQSKEEEGCLSIPHIVGKVKRYKKIRVRALNRQGKPIDFEASGFFARIAQHEIDHLNGILFIDRTDELFEIKD